LTEEKQKWDQVIKPSELESSTTLVGWTTSLSTRLSA